MFVMLDFVKAKPTKAKHSHLVNAAKLLKPCAYKKR